MGFLAPLKKLLRNWRGEKTMTVEVFRPSKTMDVRSGRYIRRTNELLLFRPGLVFTVHGDGGGWATWVALHPYRAKCLAEGEYDGFMDIEDFDGCDITVHGYQVDS
jgi:hypothetical protein